MNAIAATGNATGTDRGVTQGNQGTLGRDDFLALLVTQLQHQDPIKPMSDQEFVAQITQFSSLESIQSLSQQFQRFVDLQQWSSYLGQATGLIGKTVDLAVDDSTVTGPVSAVRIVDGVAKLVVNNTSYDMSLLQEVRA